MKQTAKVLLLIFCAALFIGFITPDAFAADISDSMLFFFPCDEEHANIGSAYWNGIVVEDSEGNIHIVASFLSAIDGIQSEAKAIMAIAQGGSAYLTLEDYDAEAGIAIYAPYGELAGVTPLPLAPSTSIASGDTVTVYGMEWLQESESYADLFRSYECKVADGAASENYNYIYMKLDTKAPNQYWENAAVMDKDGHMVAVLLSSTDMNLALPAEYILGYLGYGEDYVAPDGADLNEVGKADFSTGNNSNTIGDTPDAIDDTGDDGKGSGNSLDSAISNNASNTQVATIGSSRAALRTGITIGVCAVVLGLAAFFVYYFTKRSKAAKAAAAASAPAEVFVPTGPGKYYIIAKGGEHTGERFLVKDSMLIGRRSDVCDIILSPATYGISAEHCRLDLVDGGLELTDLGSTFGTYFEGGRLDADEPILLADGDTFSLADPNDNLFVVQFVPDEVEAEPEEIEEAVEEAEEVIEDSVEEAAEELTDTVEEAVEEAAEAVEE